jgi:hypothetical protein
MNGHTTNGLTCPHPLCVVLRLVMAFLVGVLVGSAR